MIDRFEHLNNKTSAADWAFNQLFGSIADGKFAPGERVTETQLADILGVSRTPLREAVRRLEVAGVLVRSPGRGLRIAPMSAKEMWRLSMLREALESLLVRYVAERYREGEIVLDRLEQIVDHMKAIDAQAGLSLLLQLGRDFHRELSVLADDPLTARMLEQVMVSFERYRHLVDHKQHRASEIVREHMSLMAAIRSGDGDVAGKEIRTHLQNARSLYGEYFASMNTNLEK
ncbi:GntR family transcriptional regulator [Pelagibacterium lacus]|nr:GntR family transcriptional regulator [Pelagibacterium lacus]